MLLHLDLKDFVLVDHTQLKLHAGFTTLTGETGAGKSILLDALGFLLGDKADASWVRYGQTKAEITASFIPSPAALAWLVAHDFAITNDGKPHLQLRRTLDNKGRNRCTINGSNATATQLRELGENLIDIHGQGEHQSLIKPSSQRDLLDQYAHNDDQRKAVHHAWEIWQNASKVLHIAQTQQTQLDAQREQFAWVFEELSAIKPEAGEWEKLEIEHKRLSHSATLLTSLQSALETLDEVEDSLIERTRSLHHTIANLVKLDEEIITLAEPVEVAYIQLQEAARNIVNYLKKADLDPEHLATIDARIALLHSTARKLRLPPAELPARFATVQLELAALNTSQNIIALENAVKAAQKTYDSAAHTLSNTRHTAAQRLGSLVSNTMQTLALTGGQFAVECTPTAPSSNGIDTVTFLVTANVGQPLRRLTKVASGGELARISLALCVITSAQSAVPTLIFDEVDSGIGGATADIVGQHLRQLGLAVQVLAVTHLPQVAANAHQQLKVSKSLVGESTISQVMPLNNTQRVNELARMLGGETITTTTRRHAQELLLAGNSLPVASKKNNIN